MLMIHAKIHVIGVSDEGDKSAARRGITLLLFLQSSWYSCEKDQNVRISTTSRSNPPLRPYPSKKGMSLSKLGMF